MFGFGKKKARTTAQPPAASETPSKLKLGTGDRSTIHSTKSSDQLAEELLVQAKALAEDKSSGEDVTVELSDEHLDIHHLELFLSLMNLSPKYGLQPGVQFNNQQTFTKI